LFNEEGKRENDFDARQAILGHLQQGGNPSPFDRIQAARMAENCIGFLTKKAKRKEPSHAFIGTLGGEMLITPLGDLPRMVDEKNQRVKSETQWWWELKEIADVLGIEPA